MYQEDNRPVELHFVSETNQKSCDGFIVTIGEDFLLIARLWQCSWLNGFRAVRLTEIQEVLPLSPVDERFVCRAMQARGEILPPKIPFQASTLAEFVESVCQYFPIVVFNIQPSDAEFYDPAGRVKQVQNGVVRLRSLSREGLWLPDETTFAMEHITELLFGSEYEKTLDLISQQIK